MADENGHYCFAVALRCRGPPHVPIGKFAMPCDLALPIVGLPDFAGECAKKRYKRPSADGSQPTWTAIVSSNQQAKNRGREEL